MLVLFDEEETVTGHPILVNTDHVCQVFVSATDDDVIDVWCVNDIEIPGFALRVPFGVVLSRLSGSEMKL